MTNLTIVKENLSAFSDWDKSKLHFSDDVIHRSPEASIKGLTALMDACWEKMPALKLQNFEGVEQGNQVVIKYDIINSAGTFPVMEWYTLEAGKIVLVEVFYGWKST